MGWEDEDWDEQAEQVVDDNEDEEPKAATFSDEEEVVSEEDQQVEGSKPRNPDNKLKLKKKSKQQLEQEKEEQKRAEEMAAEKAKAMSPEEIMTEKLRQQRLVEQADHKLTEELFGGAVKEDLSEDKCLAHLQMIGLDSEEDYKVFASAVAKKLELQQSVVKSKEFMKELVRKLSVMMSYDDLMEVDGILSVIKNTKVKKVLNKKKKKTTKVFAKVQRDDMDDIQDKAGANADQYEDYDFM